MVKFELSDFLYPHHILYWRWKLWRTQYESLEKIEALQWKFLSKMLDHCFDQVPYYQQTFRKLKLVRSDFQSLEDLKKIPIMSKDDLLESKELFKANNIKRFNPKLIHTSGTTGTPLEVYWDRESNIFEFVSMWRHFSWGGYRLGQPFADIRSVLPGENEPDFNWNWKCQGLQLFTDVINEKNIQQYAALHRKYRIKLWRGHPSAITYFCQLLQDAKIEDVKPKYIFTASEAVLNHQRTFVEDFTGVSICDNYGLKEHNALITQCPEGSYHINSEYGIVEILNDLDEPVKAGEEGRIVATGLHNFAFPLLRYETRDYATQSDRVCSCGRTLPLIENLTGRIDDRVRDINGKWSSGFHFAFFFVSDIKMAQIVQNKLGTLDIYIVPRPGYSDENSTYLISEFKKKLGNEMDVQIHLVDDVPFKGKGKFKFVINNVKK